MFPEFFVNLKFNFLETPIMDINLLLGEERCGPRFESFECFMIKLSVSTTVNLKVKKLELRVSFSG